MGGGGGEMVMRSFIFRMVSCDQTLLHHLIGLLLTLNGTGMEGLSRQLPYHHRRYWRLSVLPYHHWRHLEAVLLTAFSASYDDKAVALIIFQFQGDISDNIAKFSKSEKYTRLCVLSFLYTILAVLMILSHMFRKFSSHKVYFKSNHLCCISLYVHLIFTYE